MHALPDDLFIDELQTRYGGVPGAILQDPDLLQLFIPMLRADITLLETYSYTAQPPLDFPISVFGGTEDIVTREGLDAWHTQTTAAFELHMLPGNHFLPQTAPERLLQIVSGALSEDLLAAEGRNP